MIKFLKNNFDFVVVSALVIVCWSWLMYFMVKGELARQSSFQPNQDSCTKVCNIFDAKLVGTVRVHDICYCQKNNVNFGMINPDISLDELHLDNKYWEKK